MFCDDVWARSAALLRAIHEHPFNAALGEGTLDRRRFAFYIVQDARYLEAFSKALATASVRAADPEEAAFWSSSAHAALAAERTLHEGYIEEYGLSATDLSGIRTSPTCLGYSSFLQAVALAAPYSVLVAAVLPCFWVYQDVGAALVKQVGDVAGHPYRAWISTYADPDFAKSVERAKEIADRLAAGADGETRAAMTEAFVQATEYEWMFWDSAWRRETWPTEQWRPGS
ncbi:TenA family protein [Streptosporangium roseum]|uniref:Transcriptional activator, TenA family n=1 Tax=Streptosporangium roseum (strain ATCC 12428 / DSM 43021 / JCM 3005 / KCTC 9067 / NCIMB 10171 / NRRL 2505 / NI 9100) TaxID=479432 RepID=D2ATP3_STRRD|nr:TenA family protein [Streptosporangium roseum]ACZ86763.1 putative transcriptional activator, TenA family [Streptosporangium roseum DSM 43021]